MEPATPPLPLETLLAHRAWVRALARSLVRDDSTADDVAQDTWLAAMRHPPHDAATSKGWLAVVARNLARAGRRSSARRAAREERIARAEAMPGADEIVAHAETHRRVVEAVMELAEPYRSTVLHRFFEGLGPSEVAERMDVPVDTVKTRLRRALLQLRERLDPPDDERRRAALAALAALPAGDAADAAPAGRGARVVAWTAAAAFVVATAVVGASWALRADEATRGGDVAALVAAERPGPANAAGAPAPVPADDDPRPAPPPAPTPPDDAAPARGASAADEPAQGSLRLGIATNPATPRAGEPFDLLATFENAGTRAVRFFVPDHAGSTPFLDWRLRAEDGTTLVPAAWIGQSMWHGGLQGSIVELAPGATWTSTARVDEFTPVDPATGRAGTWRDRVPMRTGRVIVSCSYSKPTTDVPWSDQAFDVVMRADATLWTGTVRAGDVAVQFELPARPSLSIDAPATLVPGMPYRVEAVIENPTAADVEFPGTLVLRGSTKAQGVLLTIRPDAAGDGRIGSEALRVPAGSSRRFTFDAARSELVPAIESSYVALVATVETAGADAPRLVSNALWRAVGRTPDASASGLRVRAAVRIGPDGAPLADVALTNAGTAPLRVPREVGPLRFDVRRRDVATPQDARTPTGAVAAWRLPSQPTARRTSPDEFATILPGETLARTIDLAAAGAPVLAPGRYELTVTWSNLDSGALAGFAAGDVVVGETSSEPVPIDR